MRAVIGLEVHVQLATKSKLFCGCSNDSFGLDPNVNICPICMGHPGTLPVPNKRAIELGVIAGFAFNSEIPAKTKFDRKNYFYPDLPKGYQITQFDQPCCVGGDVSVLVDGKEKKVRLRRIHLEEDAGKLVHPEGADYSLVDYNRAGTPLAEIVTEPDISSAEEAVLTVKAIQEIVRHVGVSQADMEKGHMRFDANISVWDGDKQVSDVTEIKNLNSFKSLEKALHFEYDRHVDLIERGEKVSRETRGWHDVKEITIGQRSKEEAHDYRYFPEPDIPTIELTSEFVSELKRHMKELPQQVRDRFQEEYGLDADQVRIIVSDNAVSAYFEQVVSEVMEWAQSQGEMPHDEQKNKLVKVSADWLLSELFGLMKSQDDVISDVRITPENFAELVVLVFEKKINSSAGQIILKEMYETGNDPTHIMNEKGLKQVDDINELEVICDTVISQHADIADQVRGGKEQAIQFLVGQVMKETRGSANPQKVFELFKKKLLS